MRRIHNFDLLAHKYIRTKEKNENHQPYDNTNRNNTHVQVLYKNF